MNEEFATVIPLSYLFYTEKNIINFHIVSGKRSRISINVIMVVLHKNLDREVLSSLPNDAIQVEHNANKH